jgi:hypothetical protein
MDLGFNVTLERFELKLNPSAYISCTPQPLQFNRHCFWVFMRKNQLKNITNSTLLLFKEKHAAVRQLAFVRRIGQVPNSNIGSKMSNPDGGLFVTVSITPTLLKIPSASFLIHYPIAMLESEILVEWHKIKIKMSYSSIDNGHLMYNAYPKLFRNSFWCIDNAHDAN